MTVGSRPAAARRRPNATTLGGLAVVGVIVAFSLGSTLVKRADTAGVLVAFWRLVTTTVVWNAILIVSGRRPSFANFKQALVPGIFFGLNITAFYSGATHNSVANAELIGAMTPFLIVPIGAKYFHEYINPRALSFALIAFAGVGIVLFAAPPQGDASLLGNVLGVMSMFLWAGYISTTRHFRRQMDVVSFMATISPIAAVATLPLALIHGGLFDVSAQGWKYILLLTFITGVGAHGLMVYAQKTVPIGTIGVAQVGQPALAAIWSYLLLGETLNGWQLAGMALVLAGLMAFVVLNQRGARRRPDASHTGLSETPVATEGSGATV